MSPISLFEVGVASPARLAPVRLGPQTDSGACLGGAAGSGPTVVVVLVAAIALRRGIAGRQRKPRRVGRKQTRCFASPTAALQPPGPAMISTQW